LTKDNLIIGRISEGLKKEIKGERANLEAMRRAVEVGFAENSLPTQPTLSSYPIEDLKANTNKELRDLAMNMAMKLKTSEY
jgi:hypothetical protein